MKGSSHFESSKNGGKNVRRQFYFNFIIKIGNSDQKIYLKLFSHFIRKLKIYSKIEIYSKVENLFKSL